MITAWLKWRTIVQLLFILKVNFSKERNQRWTMITSDNKSLNSLMSLTILSTIFFEGWTWLHHHNNDVSQFHFPKIKKAFNFCNAPGLLCLSWVEFQRCCLKTMFQKVQISTRVLFLNIEESAGHVFFLWCCSKISHLHTRAAMFQFPV